MSSKDSDPNEIPNQDLPGDDNFLDNLYRKRVRQDRDLKIIVSDHRNATGTGKTTLSLKLADEYDRTDDGLTKDKCSLDIQEVTNLYTDKPEGSSIVFDEAEVGADKYEAASATNKALREIVSMGRVEQKYLIMNLPSSDQLDRDLKSLADVWILVKRRGLSLVHDLDYNPYDGHELFKKKQTLEWEDIEPDTHLKDVYHYLTREKKSRLEGGTDKYVSKDEFFDALEKKEKKARKKQKIDDAQRARDAGLSVREISKIVGMSRTWVTDHTDKP